MKKRVNLDKTLLENCEVKMKKAKDAYEFVVHHEKLEADLRLQQKFMTFNDDQSWAHLKAFSMYEWKIDQKLVYCEKMGKLRAQRKRRWKC